MEINASLRCPEKVGYCLETGCLGALEGLAFCEARHADEDGVGRVAILVLPLIYPLRNDADRQCVEACPSSLIPLKAKILLESSIAPISQDEPLRPQQHRVYQ